MFPPEAIFVEPPLSIETVHELYEKFFKNNTEYDHNCCPGEKIGCFNVQPLRCSAPRPIEYLGVLITSAAMPAFHAKPSEVVAADMKYGHDRWDIYRFDFFCGAKPVYASHLQKPPVGFPDTL